MNSLLNQIDPFSKNYEECSKCGSPMGTRRERNANGYELLQVCKKCNHTIVFNIVKVNREGPKYPNR
jgi:formylmethanofuran dehydrogenase subunit E